MNSLRAEKQDGGSTTTTADQTPKKLPKGIVLGPDGKPFVAPSFPRKAQKALTQSQMSVMHLVRCLGPTNQRANDGQRSKGISCPFALDSAVQRSPSRLSS